MDYIAVCKAFYAATGIPVVLQKNCESKSGNEFENIGELVFSTVEFATGIPAKKEWITFKGNGRPVFCGSPEFEYGMVYIDGTDLSIVIGPMFSFPVTEDLVRKFMLYAGIPAQYEDKVSDMMHSMPTVSHSRYAWILAFLNMVVNRKDYDIKYLYDTLQIHSEILKLEESHASEEEQPSHKKNASPHISYAAECRLYDIIREGNVADLDAFFESMGGQFDEGQLALSPLRHAKNTFITTVSKLVSLSAIPGGMNEKLAYDLMEIYIRECEQQLSVEAVHTLQYSMVRDFTIRIGKARLPEGISTEIYAAVEYIRSHLHFPIAVTELAEHLNRSVSYITHKFKAEMGCPVSEYINRCRLEEAKSLLLHTPKSLADISNYLCFSSQSHFQNAFKREYGITPMQFRKQSSE